MNDRADRVFYAATKIVAASCTGGRGEGLHKSPELVKNAVDVAELLVTELDKREDASEAARAAVVAVAEAITPPTPVVPPAK